MDQEALTLLSLIVSMVLSLIAVLVSAYTFRIQRREGSYSAVDEAYFKILEIAIQHPTLRDRDRTSTYFALPANDEFRLRYEAYAFACWNLVETVYDREKSGGEQFSVSSTWLPVMAEESRLHYHWYCRNVRLFKAPFQRYVMSQLNGLELRQGSAEDFADIYPRLLDDFPASELKSREQFEQLLARGEYKLYLAKHVALGVTIGYAFVYEPKTPKIAWLDYVAIDAPYRNAGFGTQLVNQLAEHLRGRRIGLMLEVEPAGSEDAETLANQQHRITFYKRIGAKQLDVEYLFPFEAEPYPLLLFFRPSAKMGVLPKEQIQAMIRAAYEYIHNDVPTRDAILQRFIHKVDDQAL